MLVQRWDEPWASENFDFDLGKAVDTLFEHSTGFLLIFLLLSYRNSQRNSDDRPRPTIYLSVLTTAHLGPPLRGLGVPRALAHLVPLAALAPARAEHQLVDHHLALLGRAAHLVRLTREAGSVEVALDDVEVLGGEAGEGGVQVAGAGGQGAPGPDAGELAAGRRRDGREVRQRGDVRDVLEGVARVEESGFGVKGVGGGGGAGSVVSLLVGRLGLLTVRQCVRLRGVHLGLGGLQRLTRLVSDSLRVRAATLHVRESGLEGRLSLSERLLGGDEAEGRSLRGAEVAAGAAVADARHICVGCRVRRRRRDVRRRGVEGSRRRGVGELLWLVSLSVSAESKRLTGSSFAISRCCAGLVQR